MSIVAFIPLRGGGERFGADKELAPLGGHPLLAWTIRSAIDSKVFEKVIAVVADDKHAEAAEKYGAEVPARRPDYTTRDGSPDIEWVLWILGKVPCAAFSILRVTSPFRTAEHIREAKNKFMLSSVDSLRTVTLSKQDVFKTWVIRNDRLLPLFPIGSETSPWHSRASQDNPKTFVQTAGMEFAWSEMVKRTKTIAGSTVVPYVLEGLPALDINFRFDFDVAEKAVIDGLVELPESLR